MRIQELNNTIDSEEYSLADMLAKVLMETYSLISDNIDLENSYEYVSHGASIWTFKDKNNIVHIEKLNYNPGVKDKAITVKFFWEDNGKPSYDKPPYTDEKVFNTHVKIFVNEVVPKIKNLMEHFNIDKITIDPTDKLRYRLYRISLSKFLKHSEYTVEEDKDKLLLNVKIK